MLAVPASQSLVASGVVGSSRISPNRRKTLLVAILLFLGERGPSGAMWRFGRSESQLLLRDEVIGLLLEPVHVLESFAAPSSHVGTNWDWRNLSYHTEKPKQPRRR